MAKSGDSGVTISSQSGYHIPALTADEDLILATTSLQLEMLQSENVKDTLHAYQLSKRCNGNRFLAEAIKWSEGGARLNCISPYSAANYSLPRTISRY